ncbi:MAG: nucleotidyltransferase [Bacteroidales bacterium]|nr:nucleotidyltransferase [Bacteroidales bacterium]
MSKPTLLILAAGMGSRYGGLKQIDKIGPSGEAIIDYSIYDAIRSGFGKVVLVIRKELEADFREFFGNKLDGKIDLRYVYQELENLPDGIAAPPDRKKPWGTAHAVLVADEAINEPFMAINADDFYSLEAYKAVASHFAVNADHTRHAMVGYQLRLTLSEFGTVSRGVCNYSRDLLLKSISEITNIERRSQEIGYDAPEKGWTVLDGQTFVSMNAWGFYPGIFKIFREGFTRFINKAKDDPKAEYYIARPLVEMMEQKLGSIQILKSDAQWFGVTYREDKESAKEMITRLVASGVYPENLWK